MSIKRNSLINLIGAGFPLLLTLVTLPFYVSEIGEERFAVVSIAWIILGYFGFFDLGLSQATASQIAKTNSGEPSVSSEIYWTALVINGFFGLVGGCVAWLASYFFFRDHFSASDQLKSEILNALSWLAIAVPIATVSGVQIGCLQGREKFLAINKINIAGSFFLQVLPLIAAISISPSLAVVMPVTIASRILVLVLLGISVNKNFPKMGSPRFKRNRARQLLNFGGWVTISAVISPIMTTFDRLLIGSIIGAKAVTYYTVSYNLANRVSIFPASLTSALFPRLAGVDAEDRNAYAKNAIEGLIVILLPLLAFGVLNFGVFLNLWMDAEFSRKSNGIGEIILLGMFFNSLARVPYVSLQAAGRPDVVAKCHIGEIVPYCLLLYFATVHFGIIGAAAAWACRSCVDSILLFSFHGIDRKNVMTAIGAAILLLALTVYSISNTTGSNFENIVINAALTAPVAIWSALMVRRIKRYQGSKSVKK